MTFKFFPPPVCLPGFPRPRCVRSVRRCGPRWRACRAAASSQTVGSPVELRTAADSRVLFLSLASLLALCAAGGGEDCARLLENLLREVSEKYWRLQRRVQCLSIPDGRRRLAFYLCAQGAEDFLLPISREQMARQLGMNRAALSRLLGQLRDEGLLRWERAHFVILRPEELRAIAEDG